MTQATQRQMEGRPTKEQAVFDVLFGVVFPLTSLIADPIVFTGGEFGFDFGFLAQSRVLVFGMTTNRSLGLLLWLLLPTQGDRISHFVGLTFVLGGLVSALLGLFLTLPTALAVLLGVMALVSRQWTGLGVLGFALLGALPWITAFVYFRNGVRALDCGAPPRAVTEKLAVVAANVVGLALAFVVPYQAQVFATRFVSVRVQIVLEMSEGSSKAISELKQAFWCSAACYTKVVLAYGGADDETRQQYFASAYFELTGKDVQDALAYAYD